MKKLSVLMISMSLCSATAYANVPTEPQSIEDERIRQITQEFEKDTADLAKYYEDRAGSIKTPDPDNDFEAMIQFDFDVTWDLTSFKMDIPKFKMENKKMSLDLPQVTMKNKEMKFDVPQVKMVTKKVGQKPEVTVKWVMEKVGPIKTKVPKTYVKWTDIKMDVPVTYTERKRIVAGVPQFKMDTTSFVMGIPKTWMETEEFKLHLPQFYLKNIKTEIKETEQQAKALQADAEKAIGERTKKFQADLSASIVEKISTPFDEQKEKLIAQMTSLEKQSKAADSLYEESIKNLKANGMQDNDPQLIRLVEQRTSVNTSYGKAIENIQKGIENLTKQQKEAIDQALNQLG
jgi:hypothetical protein